jgi:hypothetical protein
VVNNLWTSEITQWGQRFFVFNREIIHNAKTHAAGAVNKFWSSASGGRLGLGRGFGLGFGFGRLFLPLEIGHAPFPLLSFVVLLAHNDLYITNSLRLFSAL